MARWPNATWDPAPEGVDGGSYVDGYAWRGLCHTTEGRTYASAKAAYLNHRGWPHFTVTHEGGRFKAYQHLDTSRAARALRNPSGGVQTNRARCIQIEIVGTCNPANQWGTQNVEAFPTGYLDGIADLMRWVEATHGVRRSAVSVWKAYPASFGLGNGIRIPAADWPGFGGWCGHQHAPENDHGDPGLLDIAYLLGSTTDATTEAAMALTADDLNDIKSALRSVLNEGTGGGQTSWAGTSKATLSTVQGLVNAVNAVKAQVGSSTETVLATLAALDLDLSDEDIAALAAQVPDVDEAALAEAVRFRLADALSA